LGNSYEQILGRSSGNNSEQFWAEQFWGAAFGGSFTDNPEQLSVTTLGNSFRESLWGTIWEIILII